MPFRERELKRKSPAELPRNVAAVQATVARRASDPGTGSALALQRLVGNRTACAVIGRPPRATETRALRASYLPQRGVDPLLVARSVRPLVQRNLDDAKAFAATNKIANINGPGDVVTFTKDESQPLNLRQGLLAAYNKGLDKADELPDQIVLDDKTPEVRAYEAYQRVVSTFEVAAQFLQYLSPKELWQFAQTGNVSLELARRFCLTYMPSYQDRFAFNLATKGQLLIKAPDPKYGGDSLKGKPHATSAYTWYQAALKGSGPVVLGALDDYMPMRDYTAHVRDMNSAKSVEASANYLMAWPWSLLVNAALVTGAIHGRRTIVGATNPQKANSLYKDPHGLSVYARELIQLVLVGNYQLSTDASALDYPEPATGGGLVLKPPEKNAAKNSELTKEGPANIFDIDEALKKRPEYESEKDSATLLKDLGPVASAHMPITFDNSKIVDDTKKKETTKAYEALKKKLRPFHDRGVPKPTTKDAELIEMIKTIYQNPPQSVPSLPRWQVDIFMQYGIKNKFWT